MLEAYIKALVMFPSASVSTLMIVKGAAGGGAGATTIGRADDPNGVCKTASGKDWDNPITPVKSNDASKQVAFAADMGCEVALRISIVEATLCLDPENTH